MNRERDLAGAGEAVMAAHNSFYVRDVIFRALVAGAFERLSAMFYAWLVSRKHFISRR